MPDEIGNRHAQAIHRMAVGADAHIFINGYVSDGSTDMFSSGKMPTFSPRAAFD
jgi:hypothetical protein